MSRGWLVAAIVCAGWLAASDAAADEPEEHANVSVFVEPLGTIGFLTAGGLYLPLGFSTPIGPSSDVVFEITPVVSDWYGCHSTSRGGWTALGVAWFAKPHADSRGFFVETKLIGRYFGTTVGDKSCTGIDGHDYELHVGLDAGYTLRWDRFELTFVLGASLGFCGHCVDGAADFLGDAFFFSDQFAYSRRDRWSLGLNLNLLRLGWRY